MSEFKGTEETVNIDANIIFADDYFQSHIAKMSDAYNDEITEANANLIVDAFKVRQQINCELSELLEQRNEMLEVLEDLISKMPLTDNFAYATERNHIKQLIKKVKDNGNN